MILSLKLKTKVNNNLKQFKNGNFKLYALRKRFYSKSLGVGQLFRHPKQWMGTAILA
jgi:hypothetical protein